MMKKVSSVLLLVLLSCGACAQPHYLSASAVGGRDLPAPPARGSAEEASELRDVLMIQKTATPEQFEAAKKWHKFTVFDFPQFGEKFNKTNCPKTAEFFSRLDDEARFFYGTAKLYWKRPRPYTLSSDIKPLVTENDYSYPSGHALRGQLQAEVLATMFPEKRDSLIPLGQQIGYLRLVAGVHYESDLVAGRAMAEEILAKLKRNEQFVKDMNASREEILAVTK